MEEKVLYRDGGVDDISAVHDMVVVRKRTLILVCFCSSKTKELAVFEKAPNSVVLTKEQMKKDYEDGRFRVLIAGIFCY